MKSNNTALLAAVLAAACAGQAHAQAQPSQAPNPASAPSSPAKKELVQRLLILQQGAIEGMSRSVVERPVGQLMQVAANTLQAQVPAEKREAIAKSMEADIRKFVDEAVPMLRERALKLAPSTYGNALEEKFTEDELRQFVTWLESPASRKFQQLGPDMQTTFLQKLGNEANPLLGPKLQALEAKLRTTLGMPLAPGGAASGIRPAASAAASKPRTPK